MRKTKFIPEVPDDIHFNLIDDCIEEIKENIRLNDLTAMDELLRYIPIKNLIQFLNEDKWSKYKSLWQTTLTS